MTATRPVCLLFGLSGPVGRALQQRRGPDDMDWLALSRVPRHSAQPGLRWQVGQLPAQGPTLAAGETVSAIVSVGPLDAFSHWFAGTDVSPERVIALGSTSIDSKRDSVDPGECALAQRLADAEARLEQACRARGSALLLLRPTLIYGMGGDRSLSPLMALARRFRCVPISRRATGLRMPVHALDIADVIVRSVQAAPPKHGIYALPGAEQLTFQAMVRRTAKLAAPGARVIAVPHGLFLAGFALARKLGLIAGASPGMLSRLQRDLLADGDAARRELGFAPRPFAPETAQFNKTIGSDEGADAGVGPESGA